MTSFSKELRVLAWPAAGILALVVLPMVWASTFEPAAVPWHLLPVWMSAFQVSAAGFLLGAALLAALPFGTEFQHRTIGLLLAQPVSRGRVWLAKQGALTAVLVVVGVAAYAATASRGSGAHDPAGQATFLLLLACSGVLWTLVAGSTIGGAVFSLAAVAMVELVSSFIVSRMTGSELRPFAAHPALVAVRGLYAAGTVWLGWRLFARYELTTSDQAGAPLASRTFERATLLRSRPAGAFANLVRKEVRLQQPTFLIAALFVGCWIAAMLWFAGAAANPPIASAVFTVLFVSYFALALIVCGTISIGEETSLGLRAWHLTLPVSSFVQWSVKLGVTVVIAALLTVGLPILLVALAEAVAALPAGTLQRPDVRAIALAAAGLLVVSFWAGTLVGNTVLAAVAAGLTIGLLALAGAIATWAAQQLDTPGGLMTWVMVRWQLPPDAFLPSRRHLQGLDQALTFGGPAILAALALWQSLAAFRALQVPVRRMARHAALLALVVAFTSFATVAYLSAAAFRYQSRPVLELEAAVQRLAAASLERDGRLPTAITPGELEQTGLLSADTRRWLAGSDITVLTVNPRAPIIFAEVRFGSGRESRMLLRLRPGPPPRQDH